MTRFPAAISVSLALLSLVAIPAPARGAVINVTVGGPGIIAFSPPFVEAHEGDEILFEFRQKNHTVTQSTLLQPCSPAPDGFNTGFVPVGEEVTEGFPVQQYLVEHTNPIWFYCQQGDHCHHMVFAINPGDLFSEFQARANLSSVTTTAEVPTTTASIVTVTETITADDGSAVTTTYGSYPGSVQPTGLAPVEHQVEVGGDGLLFTPWNISAQPGDTVTFTFLNKNHTVTQSTFAEPCRLLADVSEDGQEGFDSDFRPVDPGSTELPTYTITVNNTAPVWAYCKQGNHCGQGMVFSINAIEDSPNNFAAFRWRAIERNGSATDTQTSADPEETEEDSGALSVHGLAGAGAGAGLAAVAIIFGQLL